jgi:ribonuclease Y
MDGPGGFATVALALALAGAAAAAGLWIGRQWEIRRAEKVRGGARADAERILQAARAEAEAALKEALLAGREEVLRLKEEWEKELAGRRAEVERLERRLDERESLLDRKLAALELKREQLEKREAEVEARERAARETVARYEALVDAERARLEQIAGCTAEEAKKELCRLVEDEARAEAAQRVREIREEAQRTAEREAQKVIAMAIQRIAADYTVETTVSVVALPNEEMKGRIIGREGRNIRAFENLTGVDVIVDDTPEAVILSAFDPVRREIARVAMEKLVADGRIHPGRIEEVVAKAKKEVEEGMRQAAEEVCYELGIHNLHPEILETLGRLKYRTSYGQNQLQHAREVALLAGHMAAELGLDVTLAKRMGLLHDIGKGMTHEHEGSHVELGYALCKRCGEPDPVLNAIRAHHDDEPARYPETFLVTAADAISGARPGARRESFEAYVKRLERLEQIASSFKGVEKVFAIQAGREVRIMVKAEEVSDEEMARLSEETARRIEKELQYPGQIKVVVVRETRAVDFAR